jgi:hypothetical protein
MGTCQALIKVINRNNKSVDFSEFGSEFYNIVLKFSSEFRDSLCVFRILYDIVSTKIKYNGQYRVFYFT